eukprot:1825635-Alexandrium_andersonii.AAC.1
MERALMRIADDPRRTGVKWARGKHTIVLRYAELKVDFTVHVGDAAVGHSATRTTIMVNRKLDELPCALRDFCRVVVDWAKQAG